MHLMHLVHLNVHAEEQVLGEQLLLHEALKTSRLLGTSGSNFLRHLSLHMVNTENQGTSRAESSHPLWAPIQKTA